MSPAASRQAATAVGVAMRLTCRGVNPMLGGDGGAKLAAGACGYDLIVAF